MRRGGGEDVCAAGGILGALADSEGSSGPTNADACSRGSTKDGCRVLAVALDRPVVIRPDP